MDKEKQKKKNTDDMCPEFSVVECRLSHKYPCCDMNCMLNRAAQSIINGTQRADDVQIFE